MCRAAFRVLAASLVLLTGLVVDVVPAHAVRVPETLAHRDRVDGRPVEPGFPIDFVGVLWDGEHRDGGAVRFRHGDRWTAWQPIGEDGAEVPGEFVSALVPGDDADAYQVRLPAATGAATAVALNTTDGTRVTVGHEPSSRAGAVDDYVTRAEWGAQESLRFDSNAQEIWPPAYHPVQKLTVHHTATKNDDVDPAATVRAIYRYHAVDRGWGDIGYQYLVDEAGRVYEGRWSGNDGDPGHDAAGHGVTAAHVGGWNSGNLGVALLGTLTTRSPSAAARAGLEDVLTDLARRHAVDPQGASTYVSPVNGAQWTGPNISGHRDWVATECPGGALYAQLPDVRAAVAARLAGSPPPDEPPPSADTTPPTAPATLSATGGKRKVTLAWSASTDDGGSGVARYEIERATASTGPFAVVTTTTGTRVVDSGLARGRTYWYRVVAVDGAGNRSGPSPVASARSS